MKTNYYKPAFFLLGAILLVGAVEDTFRSVMVNSGGLIQNDPLSKTNQISIFTAASSPAHLVRYAEHTNSDASIITSGKIQIAVGGTGTNTTYLSGVWTNGSGMFIGADASSFDTLITPSKIYANDVGHTLILQNYTNGMGSLGLYNANGSQICSVGLIGEPTNLILRSHLAGSRILIRPGAGPGVDTLSISNNLVTVFGNLIVTNGITGSVTNFGVGYTNIEVFAGGVLTNLFRTGP